MDAGVVALGDAMATSTLTLLTSFVGDWYIVIGTIVLFLVLASYLRKFLRSAKA